MAANQDNYTKPRPAISALNRPYWDALRRREFMLQRCAECGMRWYPPAPLCPRCWSRRIEWAPASGRGRVSSWVVFHQSYFRGFDAEIPYNVAEVELEEGPRLLTNLIGIRNEEIRAGMEVEVVFDEAAPDLTLAKFRPRRASA
jgi:uncharacterized OB-fold protein